MFMPSAHQARKTQNPVKCYEGKASLLSRKYFFSFYNIKYTFLI